MLVERGRDFDYVEHWHRATPHPPAAAALALRDADGVQGILLRAGNDFMFARGRTAPLPGHATLAECVAGASLNEARTLVDCEISLGHAGPGGFVIHASTLPHRVGAKLAQRLHAALLETEDRRPDGSAYGRRWHIITSEGDTRTLQD